MKTQSNRHLLLSTALTLAVGCAGVAFAGDDPVLPDWTQTTFGEDSAEITNPYLPLTPGSVSIFEGELEDGTVERIETVVTFDTVTILGVEAVVIRDTAWEDGVLVEIAHDWYAQDEDGSVWYFGEAVENYNYDDDDNLEGTDSEGTWIADGSKNLPGVIMLAEPMVGDSYYQEFAPGVALDFAVVNSLTAEVEIDFGSFEDVLHTSEGNLFDGPGVVENKLYAPGVGLVLIQELDDEGEIESEIPLIAQTILGPPTCLHDTNSDGAVDIDDLLELLGRWGTCP